MSVRPLAMQAYLHVVAFSFLALGAISLAGYLQLEQPSRHSVVLLPDSAGAAILLGLCLLASTRGWRRPCLVATALLAGLGGYHLGHNLWSGGSSQGLSLLSGFLRMSSALALGSIWLATAMLGSLYGALGKGFCRSSGWAVLTVGVAAQLASGWPPLRGLQLAFKPENTAIACLFALSLGAALLMLARQPPRSEQSFDAPSLAAGALGSLLTALIWYALSQQHADSLTRQNELLLSQARISIERAMETQLASIQRAAGRWLDLAQPMADDGWTQQSGAYLRDAPQLSLLGLLDENLQPYRLQARQPEARAWLEAFLANPTQHHWLRQVQLEQVADISQTFLHRGGEPAVLIAAPVQPATLLSGLLVAELNLQELLAPLLNTPRNGLLLRVHDGSRLVVGPPAPPSQRQPTPVGELPIRLPNGAEWRLSSHRDGAAQPIAMSSMPALVLLFGQTFSFLLMLSQNLARLTRERSEHLNAANNRLEASLQRQTQLQALNERIMQCSLDVLCSIDAQGLFTQVSPSSHSVFGYPPEEMIGRPYLEFVRREDREQAATELQAIIAGAFSQTLRHCCRRKDGSDVYILWSAAWSASDRSLFAVAHDITPLVQSEAFAEDQRDILSMISTDQPLERILSCICQMAEARDPTALCSVMLLDQAQGTLYLGAGPSLPQDFKTQLSGIPIGPAAGSCGTAVHLRQMVVVADIAADPLWQDYRALALPHGLHACWSIPLISHKDEVLGALALYHHLAMEPDDDQLQLIAIAGQLAAIAIARQRDRLLLEESQQRYRSLFAFNPDPVCSLDLNGRFQSLNQAGCELLGYAEQELRGQDFSVLLAPEELARQGQHFQAARQGVPQHLELSYRNRQGEERELELTQLPIKVEGQIVGVFAIAKDISERNRMTQALRKALLHSEHQAELLRGLNESAVSMNGIFDEQALLSLMAERLRRLIGAHQSLISLLPDSSRGEPLNALCCSDEYRAQAISVPDSAETQRMIAELAAPLLSQPELQAQPPCPASSRSPSQDWLAVPLKDQAGHNLGLIRLANKCQGEFDRDDLAVAQQFAQMAEAVLNNNRLLQAVLAGEKRLKAQLDFTSAITDSTAEGLLAVGDRGLLTFVNPAAARLIGHSAEELLGRPAAEFLPLPLDDWPLAGTEPGHRSGEFRLPNGPHGQRFMAFDYAPLLDADIQNGWVVAIRDVSAQRLADRAMRERDQFFSLSLEMFCMIDLDGAFLQVNTALLDKLGYPQECLIGHSFRGLVHPDHRPRLRENARRLLAGATLLDVELQVLDVQAQPHWLQLNAALGEDRVIYCAARDIGARKATEQALQVSLHELERSNRELQEFAFVASHDLQEPLRKIQAFAERLQARASTLDEQGQDYLQRMTSAAGRMQSLVRDLLAYSRVTSRGQAFQRLSLEQILDEVLQDLEGALEASAAQVVREALPEVDGDPLQMRQLLQNLLSNAIKFHREGEPPRIHVYAERQECGSWTLCVKDQGIGFDEKYLDRIFNPFQRLHGRQAYPGTGIGLAIVKKIVERHGARIDASSRPGQGCTFRVTFMDAV